MKRPQDIIIGKRYKILETIGKGGFGVVFSGYDLKENKNIAIKLDYSNSRSVSLKFESQIYDYLSDGVHIPHAYLININRTQQALVMELLGPSLDEICQEVGGKFCLKTICHIAIQVLLLLEYIHSRSIVHRDIKPQNFLLGRKNPSQIYIIDFGLAQKYCKYSDLFNLKNANFPFIFGTVDYLSVNAHRGIEQSYRDDLESLFYVLMNLYLGPLPWKNTTSNIRAFKIELILQKKLSINYKEYTNLPQQFHEYLNYARKLEFGEYPNYAYLRHLFHQTLKNHNLPYDYTYEWTCNLSDPTSEQTQCSQKFGENLEIATSSNVPPLISFLHLPPLSRLDMPNDFLEKLNSIKDLNNVNNITTNPPFYTPQITKKNENSNPYLIYNMKRGKLPEFSKEINEGELKMPRLEPIYNQNFFVKPLPKLSKIKKKRRKAQKYLLYPIPQ
ncbi:hypothetical protein HZS_7782 [Henneguya salminicola]|nr:hypothetical protein HZS_7782 [Henneguya salminicola]